MTKNPNHPRRFQLHRDIDHTGISGTGRVAEGVAFSDGTAVIRWLSEHASTVVWPGGIDDVHAIHGHGGATRIVWLDDDAGAPPTALVVGDSPKMLHETFCVAQACIGNSSLDQDRRREHLDRIGRLIAECERHRPLGRDGKHGELHTPTCGCEDTAGARRMSDITDVRIHRAALGTFVAIGGSWVNPADHAKLAELARELTEHAELLRSMHAEEATQ